MTRKLTALNPRFAADLLNRGLAVLVDIREPDEFARRHIKGALSRPLSTFQSAHLKVAAGQDVIFTCRTGMRTSANCDRLLQTVQGDAFILDGGVDGWAAAGLPVQEDRKAPLEIMRQVQIIAGGLVLLGAILSATVNPAFIWLSGLMGAGLLFAGSTGWRGMAKLLSVMPWNRTAA